jgi:hypothetical protein
MNVRLQYDLDFVAGVYAHEQLHFNSYSIVLQLLTQTTNSQNSNVALERVKAFIYYELGNTVFLGPSDHDKADMLAVLGVNVTTLPEEPVDQIVGLMLFTKLNAVMEDRMIVTELDIQSTMGDCVWYMHSEGDALGPFARDGWWTKPGRQHNDLDLEAVKDNVVKVAAVGWTEWDLDWPDTQATNNDNTVLFASFTRNENQ